jgi:transposase
MNFYDHKGEDGGIEGFNNKVKTLIRRHYGFRDKEFLKLKIIQIGSASLKDYVPYPWFSTE